MATKRHLQHIKSSVADKVPVESDLLYGEIAVNYAADKEKFYIKNSDDDIVSFSSDKYFIDIIHDNEYVVASHIAQINDDLDEINSNIEDSKIKITEITYSELGGLKANAKLVPGMLYRITDYVTVTKATMVSYDSAEHPFDIIVLALSNDTLSEDAKAMIHNGDTYFSDNGCDLNAWTIKYCFENSNKYDWAFQGIGNNASSKGVIYYMKDEWGNECPYDFKNIRFKRSIKNGVVDEEKGTDTYLYTFSWINDNDEVEDASVMGRTIENSDYSINIVHDNIIKPVLRSSVYTNNSNDLDYSLTLNNIVFISSVYHDNGNFGGINNNTIEGESFDIVFGADAKFNNIGFNVSSCVFSGGFEKNNIGSNVTGIVVLPNYVRYIDIENGNKYIALESSQLTDKTNWLQNITIGKGVNSLVPAKTITHNTTNDAFRTTYLGQNSIDVNV